VEERKEGTCPLCPPGSAPAGGGQEMARIAIIKRNDHDVLKLLSLAFHHIGCHLYFTAFHTCHFA